MCKDLVVTQAYGKMALLSFETERGHVDQVPCYVLCTPDYTVMGKKYSVPPGQG